MAAQMVSLEVGVEDLLLPPMLQVPQAGLLDSQQRLVTQQLSISEEPKEVKLMEALPYPVKFQEAVAVTAPWVKAAMAVRVVPLLALGRTVLALAPAEALVVQDQTVLLACQAMAPVDTFVSGNIKTEFSEEEWQPSSVLFQITRLEFFS